MAHASYRHRSDGVIEILRPRPWQRRGSRTRTAAGVLGMLLAATLAMSLYAAIGAAFLVFAVCFAVGIALWRSGQRRRGPAPQRLGPQRRTAP